MNIQLSHRSPLAFLLLAPVLSGFAPDCMADNPLKVGSSNSGTLQNSIAAGSSNNLGSDAGSNGGSILVGGGNLLDGGSYQALFGDSNRGYAFHGLAAGAFNANYGYASVCLGWVNTVNSGNASMAFGHSNISDASYAIAIGDSLTARTLNGVVVGRWNAALPGETYFVVEDGKTREKTYPDARTLWRGTDSLFVVGNGTAADARSNAFVVRKDGAVDIPTGPLTVAGQRVLTTGSITKGGILAVGPGSAASEQSAIAFGSGA